MGDLVSGALLEREIERCSEHSSTTDCLFVTWRSISCEHRVDAGDGPHSSPSFSWREDFALVSRHMRRRMKCAKVSGIEERMSALPPLSRARKAIRVDL